jgi:1-acyl-sn-glycerol-3-phosphate acyltransferase
MLTLDIMKRIELTARPPGQKVAGWIIRANYRFPASRTRVTVRDFDRIPDRPVYIAMNHSDKFNYWPFQIHLWKERDEFTATWVKGKYYNQAFSRSFLVATNNIPTPSRGYLITADVVATLNKPPAEALYRLMRDATDEGWDDARLLQEATEQGFKREITHLMKTPRNILGLDFHPFKHGLVERHRELFRQMMDAFIDLNFQAFDKGLRIMVFPEGTRSTTLGKGKPGLAQMALRTRSTVVPVGSNGSEVAYPGEFFLSRGGDIEYRVGHPMTPEGDLKPFQIDEDFRPFTNEAHRFEDKFEGATELIMSRIAELIDPHYLEGSSTAVEGSHRFV